MPEGVQSAVLKVSQRMRVTLSAEGNPNEFKIEPDGTEDVQLVAIDGTARWQWKVTPKEPANDQKMSRLQAIRSRFRCRWGVCGSGVKYLFWNDPAGLLKYLWPGGAGCAFAAGLVMWWWQRPHPKKKMAIED